MEVILGILVAAFLSFLSGFAIKLLLSTKPFKFKVLLDEKVVPSDLYHALQPKGIEDTAIWLGNLERLIGVLAGWTGTYELLAGWFALKVASKWETYGNVLKMPEKIEGVSDLDYLRARRAWGSRVMMRFLAGSAANALVGVSLGLLAKPAGKFLWEALISWCPGA